MHTYIIHTYMHAYIQTYIHTYIQTYITYVGRSIINLPKQERRQ